MSRRLPLVALFAVAALALAACGTKTLDTEDAEQQMAEQLSADANPPVNPDDVSVDCPDDIEVEEGGEFECTLTAPNGDEVRVDVTLTDDDGGFQAVVPPEQFE